DESMDDGDDLNDKLSFAAKVLSLMVQYGVSMGMDMAYQRFRVDTAYLFHGYGVSISQCSQFLVYLVLVEKLNRKELEVVPYTIGNLTPPRTPQLNGVAERRNKTLLDMVRSMMSRATLPISFWGYALDTATHILNLVPPKKVSKTPFEMWKGKRPSLRHIKVWGCEVYVRREAQDKLEARSEKCIFFGYPEDSFGYLLYKLKENVVFVSQRGVFLEREMISKEDNGCKIYLEEIPVSVDKEPIVNTDTQQEGVTPVEPDDISLPIRRTSGRVSKPPQFYYGFHIEEDKTSDSN
nr:retrotransposon protein, putative, Ty1-copia subclass [Tanacetum cinerariifolium]